jgi:hypothetical protein
MTFRSNANRIAASVPSAGRSDTNGRLVLEQGDHVVHVLLCDLADLQLGDQDVGRRDGVGVDVQTTLDVDVVVHAHDIQEDVDVIDHRGREVRCAQGTRPLEDMGARLERPGALEVLELRAPVAWVT